MPGLPETVEKLVVELVTLPFSQQNEIWNALRCAYHPSVLYRMRLVTFRDGDGMAPAETAESILRVAPS